MGRSSECDLPARGTLWVFMASARPGGLRGRCFGWFLVVLALLVAPTGLGRGMLQVLVEGPCPPDCTRANDHVEADEGHVQTASSSERAAEHVTVNDHADADHACAWQAERDHCPPDCGDCTCCGTPTVAVFDFPTLTFGTLEAFRIDWRGPPSPVRTATRPGLYRPPKRSLA